MLIELKKCNSVSEELSSEVSLSAMKPEDYSEVLKLWRSVDGVKLSLLDTKRNLHRYLERNPEISSVVRHDSTIVGAVLTGHDGMIGYLYHMAVDPNFREYGLGSSLVERSMSELKKQGIYTCKLSVSIKNQLGKSFWEKSGWKREERSIGMTRHL